MNIHYGFYYGKAKACIFCRTMSCMIDAIKSFKNEIDMFRGDFIS